MSQSKDDKNINKDLDRGKKLDDRDNNRSRRRSLSRSASREDRRRRSLSKDRRRDRSRERDRDRHRERDRERSRDRRNRRRSRSPVRDLRDKRHSDRRRSRTRSRSLSPLSKRIKARQQAEAEKNKNGPPPKFWDGFQWVDRLPTAPAATTAEPTAVEPSTLALGNQKDRRVYVGNLPPGTTPEILKEFMNVAMQACGGVPPGISSAVLSVWMGPDNKYSFVEMCTAETATVALGLTGISYQGVNLRIARPKSYSETPVVTNMVTTATGAFAGVLGAALPLIGTGSTIGLPGFPS